MPIVSGGSGGGSAGAWTLISNTTLGADGTFDVSGISGSFNDLVLMMMARSTIVALQDPPSLVFNADSGANYYREEVRVNGAGAVSGRELRGSTSMSIAAINAASATAGRFSPLQLVIPGYASTSWQKSVFYTSFASTDLSTGQIYWAGGGGHWASTAAVTRVTVSNSSLGNLLAGSQLRIYGVL